MKKSTVNFLIKVVVAGITFCVVAIFALKADAQTDTFGYNHDDEIEKDAKQRSEIQSTGETLVVPPPDSSTSVSQAIVKYLELTPVQIATIQMQIEKERGRVRPLVKRLARNRRAMTAATVNGRFDVHQVRELAAQQARILEPLIVANARLQTEVYKILMIEQQRKMDGMNKETAGLIHPSFTESTPVFNRLPFPVNYR
jgi:Spy/CpxP family protein refolding chaperone